MNNIIECESCGAKMRVKPATLRIIKELKCAKCRKTIVIPPELKEAAKNGTLNTTVGKPAAPATMAAPSAPKVATVTPKPINIKKGKEKPATKEPQVAGVPAEVKPVELTLTAQASAPGTPPVTAESTGAIEKRITVLEKTVADLETRISGLLKAEQLSAKQLADALETL